MADPVKPGYRTSEFWLSALTSLGALVGALAGTIPDTVATIAAAVITAAYAIARALTKKTPPVVVAP